MSATALLLATRSEGKIRELRPMFAAAGLTILGLDEMGIEESDEEDGLEVFDTFEENALAKARYFYEVSGGIPTVADDSGLVVPALGGQPGVRSKRYSGRSDLSGAALDAANIQLLLETMREVTDRRAKFVCVAAHVSRDGETVTRGESEGEILRAPRGSLGFGYDPLFFSPELGGTFGERGVEEKERVSHRGRAFAKLLADLATGR